MKVGSRPALLIIDATKLVVVVLPCVPAIAMPLLLFIKLDSISALARIGIKRLFASIISELSSAIAVDLTTISMPSRLDALCSYAICIPNSSNR